MGADTALKLAAEVSSILVFKGKKNAFFDVKKSPPEKDALLAAVLGPTGNLRAPTLRAGKTLLVGFNKDAYEKQFK